MRHYMCMVCGHHILSCDVYKERCTKCGRRTMQEIFYNEITPDIEKRDPFVVRGD